MKTFTITLKILAPVFLLVAALHLVMGAGAEVLLGAKLSSESLSDAVLDSQNRFYGVVFAIYAVVLYIGATDVPKYSPILRGAFWVFFAGGLARLVSIAVVGLPSMPVLGLLATELIFPLILLAWLSTAEKNV